MKKIILLVIYILLVVCSCTQLYQTDQNQREHDFDLENLGYNSLYYTEEFDSLTSFYAIAWYIHNHITYVEGSTNTDPETILLSGEANCKGFSVLFANIAYFSMDIRVSIASVDSGSRTREIIDGGPTNHSICYWEGLLVDPQGFTNLIVEYSKIGYLYPFDTFLY